MKPWPTMDDVLRAAREFKAELEQQYPELRWRHSGNCVQLDLLGTSCPPCTNNCRQGRDCPANKKEKNA